MARPERILSARAVAALTKPGRHADGGGLYLLISDGGRRRWVWQYQWRGKTREMGLGSGDTVALKDARDERDKWRGVLQGGKDPIEERDAGRKETAGVPTFGKIADDLIESKGPEWRNAKHKAQWTMTLEVYAAKLRNMRVDKIDTPAIVDALRPIWSDKPETASRVRGRIESVLDVARVMGYRPQNEANPARWRGHLDKILPRRGKLSRGHHAAMPYADVPAFVAKLRAVRGMSAFALEWTILTAARSGETFGATWAEIDLKAKVWSISAERMKAKRPHRVPLSDAAMDLLETMAAIRRDDFIFQGQRFNKPLSTMALEMVMRRMSEDFTVHGFRSAFRDWAGDSTSFPRDIIETALAHAVGDETEQAYRRGDALDRRRELMQAWATHCASPCPDNVVQFKPSSKA